jgi:hypothetical protein
MTEIKDAVLVSIMAVADRETAEKLKERFGDKPLILGEASHIENPNEIELDILEDYKEFAGAFNSTFVAGAIEEGEMDEDGEPFESIFISEMDDDD